MIYLVPQDRPFVVTEQEVSTDIDQIFVGQEVTLRFSALDQRYTPDLFGTLVQVSAGAFEDASTRMSYYRAEIEMKPGEAARLPLGTVLISGMPVESYIHAAERSPIAYLIKPLADYCVKAFREA
ncbi:HlyD family secretion protein [Pseudophaeobacter sp.]|uniref:HlyD family secretion protein n=1 Tax=Pseudophaeobacter sp. TaxID=1971739 RepID=UPI0032997726